MFDDFAVNSIEGVFVVPDYQRGYRWGSREVTQLLEDITAASDEKRYYLQPVVVKRDGGQWELVDGQQRLTTLFLLTHHLYKLGHLTHEPRFSLRYATRDIPAIDPLGEERPTTGQYLNHPTQKWSMENIDFHHIYEAHMTIEAWAGRRDAGTLRSFAEDVQQKVRLLWFEAPAHLSGEEMFTRLNSGRIPLSDAELVKALVFSRVDQSRQAGVAAQWDAFERDLRDPGVWAFLAGQRGESSHISILLDALADEARPPATPREPFHTFNTLREWVDKEGAQAVWDRVVHLHSLALGWTADQDLYHMVGYLVAVGARTFGQLVSESRGASRTVLHDYLRGVIATTVPSSIDALLKLRYDDSRQRRTLERALLLMNVETMRRAGREKFPFAEHQIGDPTRVWSLEHIRPQSSGRLSEKARRSWLEDHAQVLIEISEISEMDGGRIDTKSSEALLARIADASSGVLREVLFEELRDEVLDLMDVEEFDLDQVHSISNLALLLRDQNSSLGNKAFELKRRRIIELDRRGEYVPVCTRNAFLKYYTTSRIPVLHYWGDADRDGYLEEIGSLLYPDAGKNSGENDR